MGNSGVDQWRYPGLHDPTDIQPQTGPLEIPAWNLQLHIALKEDLRHLFRNCLRRFHASGTDKTRYARGRNHRRTTDAKRLGNGAVPHVRVGLLLTVTREE
ncbi:hypothetical protein D3C81_2119990 [compost metagenome]